GGVAGQPLAGAAGAAVGRKDDGRPDRTHPGGQVVKEPVQLTGVGRRHAHASPFSSASSRARSVPRWNAENRSRTSSGERSFFRSGSGSGGGASCVRDANVPCRTRLGTPA